MERSPGCAQEADKLTFTNFEITCSTSSLCPRPQITRRCSPTFGSDCVGAPTCYCSLTCQNARFQIRVRRGVGLVRSPHALLMTSILAAHLRPAFSPRKNVNTD